MATLTDPAQDFPRWYQEIIAKAQLADNGPVRGTLVIRPYAYGIWELMQTSLDKRIKAMGVENAYFPLFIPESYLRLEEEQFEGFSPELAVVTYAGGKELREPIVIRPTSETIIGRYMAKWVQSHRDLPLLLNQWANVVRWEKRPRTFLRTTEFLWQEGHTAHASEPEAHEFAHTILTDIYRDFMESELAIPVVVGRKTDAERFPGAVNSMTCEGMMGDGKALQMGTSHELGQNFSRAFKISVAGNAADPKFVWTTSWGVSTRLLGGLIMSHGDARGLRVPPAVAPIQCVILPVGADSEITERVSSVCKTLREEGVRCRVDDQIDRSLGRRITDWELKGVPLRMTIGIRELEANEVSIVRRDTSATMCVATDAAHQRVPELLKEIQQALYDEAAARLAKRVVEVSTIEDAIAAGQNGFARMRWRDLGETGEVQLGSSALSVRCLTSEEGLVPRGDQLDRAVAVIGRSY